ncbi:hypothetical protein DPEC_G00010160 [Dallia pectoralis]|uniref:Uncharacterized protein n=1 Tax=Dallia pectoralis TaxID=75939 RepID=A0ACC2HLD4_DALPE|nr:hypothetical protein DPEC_G00010160 [Dallia pectoralis]
MRGTGECRYCGTQHRRGRDLCPAFGKACRSYGTPNHFAKVCMKRGQNSRQLHTIDGPPDDEGGNLGQIYTTMNIGAVNTQGKKWFVNLPLQNGPQRCQLDLVTVTQPTDWISNLVIVKKPEKLRLCIDPRPLNRALKRSHYLMPTLDDVLYKLCRLDEESSLMTTFWTPWGRKHWLKLPFCAPKCLQSMLLTLQNYCLKVVYKPGPEMYISDTLSRAATPIQSTDTQYSREMVCSLQQEQYDTAAIQQTDYLNVTSQRLTQIRQHTEKDECLQTLKTVVLEGWQDCREDTPIVIRAYWAIRDEISVPYQPVDFVQPVCAHNWRSRDTSLAITTPEHPCLKTYLCRFRNRSMSENESSEPSSSTGASSDDEQHPWPYLDQMFSYVRVKDLSYRMKCRLCLPKCTERGERSKSCGSAGEIEFGQFEYSGVEFGDTATGVCNEGYHLVGENVRNCMNDGWDGSVPVCEPVRCDDPPMVINAEMHGYLEPPYTYSRVISYRCLKGELRGSCEIYCTKDGTWTDPPECFEGKSCGSAGEIEFGQFEYSGVEFGDTATGVCNEGYHLVGENVRNCMNDGWDGSVPVCEPVRCDDPPMVINAEMHGYLEPPYTYSRVISYRCLKGELRGSCEIYCTKDGTWTDPPECFKVLNPSNVKHSVALYLQCFSPFLANV